MNVHPSLFGTSLRSILRKLCVALVVLMPVCAAGQTNPHFDVSLRVDFSSADELLDFLSYRTNNAERSARQPGNLIAAATSLLLARTDRPPEDFALALQSGREAYSGGKDIYGLRSTVTNLEQLKKLLAETKKRRLDRRVVATIASFFPDDASVSLTVPVYVVAMGNENASAFVRRVAWKNNAPVFVGEGEGEQVIVLNLTRCLDGGDNVDREFIQVLSTLAHECFHAVYGAYRSAVTSAPSPNAPVFALADLVQNEGIAYKLSLEIQAGGAMPPPPWFDATGRAVRALNSALLELQSPSLTPSRARELLMNSNLSGSFEGNYGATAGLRMAYEIDSKLGRQVLTETIREGTKSFFMKYLELCRRDSNLPRLEERAVRFLLE